MNPALIPLIVGGVQTITDLIQGRSNQKKQEKQNQLDWEHTKELYQMQRNDAVTDWEKNNAYNSPEQQMNRLRQAGLNPHLVYGKGAENTAVMTRSSSVTPVKQETPKLDISGISNGITRYQQVKMQQVQTDNINALTAVAKEDAILRAAQTANTISQTAKTRFETQQAMELKEMVIERAKLENEKLRADTLYTLDENDRRHLATSANIKLTLEQIVTEKLQQAKLKASTQLDTASKQKTLEEIKNLETARENLTQQTKESQSRQKSIDLENEFKEADKILMEKGIMRDDPRWYKVIMKWLTGHQSESFREFMERQGELSF